MQTSTPDTENIDAKALISRFHEYLDQAGQFTPGNVDTASRPYVTQEIPSKTRWFPMVGDRVQTSFPPEIDYWVDKAATTLENQLKLIGFKETILANLNAQQQHSLHHISLARALQPPLESLLNQLIALDDARLIVGFLAAFIPNGLDGFGLIFIHLDIFLVNQSGHDAALKDFLLNTPFAGQFVNSDLRLSETICPYKSFSITAIDKHIYAAIQEFYELHPGVSIAPTSAQQGRNRTELGLLAGKIMDHFLGKLPPEIDVDKFRAVMLRK